MLYAIYQWWFESFTWENQHATEGWAHSWRFLNLLQYITFRAALACLLSFAVSLLCGERVIRILESLKLGQPLRSAAVVHKLNELHGAKAGTPTMGGVLILGSVLVSTLVCSRPLNPFVAVSACTMLALGLLGFCDDYKKVKEHNSDGMSARAKLRWQLLIGLVAGLFIFCKMEISGFGAPEAAVKVLGYQPGFRLGNEPIGIGSVCFPLFKFPLIDLKWLAIPFFALVIISSSNAVI